MAAFCELGSARARLYPTSDLAVLEDGVRHAGRQIVGPYSQFGFRHPGPLLFWTLWPFYEVSGQKTVALHLGALVMNAACLCGALFVCLRTKERVFGVLNFVAVAILVHYLAGYVSAVVDSSNPSAFVDIWNPIVTIVPFAAFCAASALVALGRAGASVAAVALHAFVCETHVGYAPVATGMLALSFALAVRSTEKLESRWLLVAAVVGALCWSPAVVDTFFGSQNVGPLVSFFISSRPRPALIAAFVHAATQLEAPLLYAFGALEPAKPSAAALPIALLVAEVALLVRCSVEVRRTVHVQRLAALALAGILLAVLSAKSLDPALPRYPTVWFGVIGLFGWASAIGGAVSGAAKRSPDRASVLGRSSVFVPISSLLVVLAVSVFDAVRTHTAYRAFRAEQRPDSEAVPVLSDAVQKFARGRREPVLLTVQESADWELLAGVVLELERRGVPFRLDGEWRFMFGAGHRYGRPDFRSLRVSEETVLDDGVALATHGRAGVYGKVDPERQPKAPDAALWFLQSSGTRGDPGTVLSAAPPAEGTPWDDSGAVILADSNASILFGSTGALIDHLDVLADANDQYAIDASVDGRMFREIVGVPEAEGVGLRWRRLALTESTAAPLLRVRAVSGDGLYSVAGLVAHAARWGVAILGATSTDGRAPAAADGRRPKDRDAWGQDEAAFLSNEKSSLTALLPIYPLASIEWMLRGPARYAVEGSVDCSDFASAGVLDCERPTSISVLQLTGREMWRCVRISPVAPYGLHAVAEIIPRAVPDAVVLDLGTAPAREHLREGWSGDEFDGWESWVWAVGQHASADVALLPGAAYELLLDARPHLGNDRHQRMTVRLNGAVLGNVDLSAGSSAVALDVPHGVATPTSRLAFDFADAISPLALGESEDPRLLAVRFDRIAFIPAGNAN